MLALRAWTLLVHHLRDESGRPLGEHRAPESLGSVPMDLVPSPYTDSRAGAGKPMNVSALREMLRHWRVAASLLARIRREVPVVTATDVWRVGQIAESLPYLTLLRSGGETAGVVIPGAVAALYKAMLGTNAGVLGYMLDAAPSQGGALPSVDDILEHVHTHGLLIGPQQVCAGPEALIRETLATLIHGSAEIDEEADRIFASEPGLGAFGRARAALLLARAAFGCTAYSIFADVVESLRDAPRAVRDAVDQVMRSEPTHDQLRFAASSHSERIARLRTLLDGADGGDELLAACDRALAVDRDDAPSRNPLPISTTMGNELSVALARQEQLEQACRQWIAARKRNIVSLLPASPERDAKLGLRDAEVPSQTPMRRLVAILGS
jgi:hypothetical protein